jgi:hypothetical protein
MRLGSDWHAVLAETKTEQAAFVPMFATVAVFWSDYDQDTGRWRTVHVGDMPGGTPIDLDALCMHVEALAECPACHGSGEVSFIETNEAGHHERVVAPCPACVAVGSYDLPF